MSATDGQAQQKRILPVQGLGPMRSMALGRLTTRPVSAVTPLIFGCVVDVVYNNANPTESAKRRHGEKPKS